MLLKMLSSDATTEENLNILTNCYTVFNIRNSKCTIIKMISLQEPMFISVLNNSVPTSQKTNQTVNAI
jgi:hypothetical protein